MAAPHAVEVQDGLPNPQRLLAFSTLAMAISMAVLDGTIVTVALPTMARQARMRSSVFSCAAGRRIALKTAGEAC